MNGLTSVNDNTTHNGTNGVKHNQTQRKEKVVIVGSGNWQVLSVSNVSDNLDHITGDLQ
jgi:hypothetical protein